MRALALVEEIFVLAAQRERAAGRSAMTRDGHERDARPAGHAVPIFGRVGEQPADGDAGQHARARRRLEHVARDAEPAVEREGDLDDHPRDGSAGEDQDGPVAAEVGGERGAESAASWIGR